MGDRRKTLRAICLISLLCLVLFWAVSIRFTSQPTFCADCHEMKAQTTSWQVSTHNKSVCVQCHHLSFRSKNAMLISHVVQQPLELASKGVDCLNCHNKDRVITPTGDLIVPHNFHMLQGIECGRCHPAEGHLNLTVKPVKSESDGVMALCLKCHFKQGGTLNCRNCHRNPPLTPSHVQPGWLFTHGVDAEKDIKACNKCHKYTLFLDSAKGDSLQQALAAPAEYARDNPFCADCHRQRPASHNYYFAHDHPALAVQKEDSCEVCHSFYYPLPNEQLPSLYCQKCHAYKGWIPLPYSQLKQ